MPDGSLLLDVQATIRAGDGEIILAVRHLPREIPFRRSGRRGYWWPGTKTACGGFEYLVHSNEFRPMAEGTYMNYVTFQGHYKLP
jgi:hypothetical protein